MKIENNLIIQLLKTDNLHLHVYQVRSVYSLSIIKSENNWKRMYPIVISKTYRWIGLDWAVLSPPTQYRLYPLVYTNMGWLGDGSHRGQGRQWAVRPQLIMSSHSSLNNPWLTSQSHSSTKLPPHDGGILSSVRSKFTHVCQLFSHSHSMSPITTIVIRLYMH